MSNQLNKRNRRNNDKQSSLSIFLFNPVNVYCILSLHFNVLFCIATGATRKIQQMQRKMEIKPTEREMEGRNEKERHKTLSNKLYVCLYCVFLFGLSLSLSLPHYTSTGGFYVFVFPWHLYTTRMILTTKRERNCAYRFFDLFHSHAQIHSFSRQYHDCELLLNVVVRTVLYIYVCVNCENDVLGMHAHQISPKCIRFVMVVLLFRSFVVGLNRSLSSFLPTIVVLLSVCISIFFSNRIIFHVLTSLAQIRIFITLFYFLMIRSRCTIIIIQLVTYTQRRRKKTEDEKKHTMKDRDKRTVLTLSL